MHDTYKRELRQKLMSKLLSHFGEKLLIMKIEGCASLMGFRKYIEQILKINVASDVDNVESVINVIKKETRQNTENKKVFMPSAT